MLIKRLEFSHNTMNDLNSFNFPGELYDIDLDSLRSPKFNKVVDKLLFEKPIEAEEYAECNHIQKVFIQVIKRAFKRHDYKDAKRHLKEI